MRRLTVLAVTAALLVAGVLIAGRWSGPQTPAVVTTTVPAPPPAATAPPTADVILCGPAPDVDTIVLRGDPSARGATLATLTAPIPSLTRLDVRAIARDGDWIQVRDRDRTGWVDAREVRCPVTPAQARALLGDEVDRVLAALAARDLAALAPLVHPIRGLRLSPTVDIDPAHSVVLPPARVAGALADRTARRWGSEDGSGAPMVSTFARYYDRFVTDRDYRTAAKRSFNEFGQTSTTHPNIREVYPHAIVVECHVPGTKPEREGLDWASLLLVFELHDGRWYLTALVHDHWTI